MSNYTQELTWNDWEYRLQQSATQINTAIKYSFDQFKKWYDYSYGKDDTTLASELGVTVSEVTDIKNLFGVFNDLNSAMNNTAVTADDRLTKLLKFI